MITMVGYSCGGFGAVGKTEGVLERRKKKSQGGGRPNTAPETAG